MTGSGTAYLISAQQQEAEADGAESTVASASPAVSALTDPVADAGASAHAVSIADSAAAAGSMAAAEVAVEAETAAVADTEARQVDESVESANRVPRPILAGAGVVGLVLLAAPLLVMALVNHADPTPAPVLDPAAFQDKAGPHGGLVPGAQPDTGAAGGLPNPVALAPPGAPAGQQAAPGGLPAGQAPPAAPGGPPAAPQAPAGSPPAAQSAQPFVMVAGPGCSAGSFGKPGYYTKGEEGWLSSGSGGYGGDGCNGGFYSVPMSGDNHDGDNSAVWNFTTGPVSQGSCQVLVYVPTGDATRVGGNPSYYTVSSGGSFQINQTQQQGRWVDAGRFPVSGGKVSVQLHSRGVDWKNSGGLAHHAAAQMKVACT
ncbi:hypothetical protein [Amycolatopsis sp. NPDC059021]|uniref:hypothetical protein n=1 Tax=Amycolatopsis sp. NPDC059021 TaxID=3346704 RepID=UPI00366AD1CA